MIDKKKGKEKSYTEWLADKEVPTDSQKTLLRKLVDKTIIDSNDFIERMKSQNISIDYGNSKKYGIITKYKILNKKNSYRSYSLGNFYFEENIKEQQRQK